MKKNILILGGGRSLEHEVSLMSAKNILQNISLEKYNVEFVGITKKGDWVWGQEPILEKPNEQAILNPALEKIFLEEFLKRKKINVVFPVLHGSYGEDGSIQGFLETLGITFVGSGVSASAICMDKTLTKILLQQTDILTAKFLLFEPSLPPPLFTRLQEKLQSTKIVLKATSQGSSVGVYLCRNQQELVESWKKLQQIGDKILAEECIIGREIEIAVLGNEKPKSSLAGEILLKNYDFYSYQAKYLDEQGVELLAPTKMEKTLLKKMQEQAIKAYQLAQCTGMARVDFFLTKNKIYLNEINSIPGFTKISMYPKLWQASGLTYSNLISKLIELALEKNRKKKRVILKSSPFHLL